MGAARLVGVDDFAQASIALGAVGAFGVEVTGGFFSSRLRSPSPDTGAGGAGVRVCFSVM